MVDLTEPEIIPLTNNSLEIIEAVNRHVNRGSIAPPRRDLEGDWPGAPRLRLFFHVPRPKLPVSSRPQSVGFAPILAVRVA